MLFTFPVLGVFCLVLFWPWALTFLFISKRKVTKEKEIFCQSLRWQKSSSTLLSFGYWRLRGAGFLPVQYYYLAFCHGLGFGVLNLSTVLSSSASKGTIRGWAFLYLSAGVLLVYSVFCSFLVLPVYCRSFNGFWYLSGWLSILFTFAGCMFLPVVC
jgi:hypothetical protein